MATLLDVRTDSELRNKVNDAFAAVATAGLAEDSKDGLDMLASAMGLSAGEALSAESVTHEDALGLSHTRYRQRIGGVPIWGKHLTITRAADGNVRRMHGEIVQGIAADVPDVVPAYGPKEAVERVKQILRRESDLGDATQFFGEACELVVYIDQSGRSRLCYEVRIAADLKEGGGRPTSPTFLLDAKTKAPVKHFDELATFIPGSAPVASSVVAIEEELKPTEGIPGKGTGPGGNAKTGPYRYGTDYPAFDVTVEGQDYIMETEQVRTVDLNHREAKTSPPFRYKGPENTHEECNGGFCALNGAHNFGLILCKMYKDWFGTSPLQGDQVILGVHYSTNYDNAWWSPSLRMMAFGDGYRIFYPLVSPDVVAHELSHAFTTDHSDLNYAGESGGINEAFSDMAGEAAEFYMKKTNDFEVGATIFKKPGEALRYMYDPPKDGRSIASAKDYYDGLDMHYSSGVYNKAFYHLTITPGWDTKKAFEIFVRANMNYWQPTTNFAQGARAVVDAAEDLGYATADVIAAFAKVDIAL